MNMVIDLTRLRNGIDSEVVVDETYSVPKEDLEHTGVTSIDDVKITGTITVDSMQEIYLTLEVNGAMIIPCAITLKPVNYPFSINIEGTLEEILEETPEKTINCQNRLDILPIIWENILMEIPIKVVNDDVSSMKIEGDGWKFITDEETKEVVNSEFEKLKDLF